MSSQSFSSYSLPGLLLQLHVHTVVLSLGIREICLPKFHTHNNSSCYTYKKNNSNC